MLQEIEHTVLQEVEHITSSVRDIAHSQCWQEVDHKASSARG